MRNRKLLLQFLSAASTVVIFAAASCVAGPALAQDAAGVPVEEVVVTGTNIAGTNLVGSDLVTVTDADIAKTGAQTVGQMLLNVPSPKF